MSGMLYTLEDHFAVIADGDNGWFSRWVSRGLSCVCALAGDALRSQDFYSRRS